MDARYNIRTEPDGALIYVQSQGHMYSLDGEELKKMQKMPPEPIDPRKIYYRGRMTLEAGGEHAWLNRKIVVWSGVANLTPDGYKIFIDAYTVE